MITMTVQEFYDLCKKHNALDVPMTSFCVCTVCGRIVGKFLKPSDVNIDPETLSLREVMLDCNRKKGV